MKRVLNTCLLLTSLIGYLEWGKGNHTFLFQTEYDLIFETTPNSETFLHPFILLPLCGQLILLFSIFQKMPGRVITLVGLGCLSTIMLMLFIVGIMTSNARIFLSTIPFMVTGILTLRYKETPTGTKGH